MCVAQRLSQCAVAGPCASFMGKKKKKKSYLLRCGEISGRGGGILRYPSPSTDQGLGRPPAGIFDIKEKMLISHCVSVGKTGDNGETGETSLDTV